jgi:outer membrane protein assembly factor BamA
VAPPLQRVDSVKTAATLLSCLLGVTRATAAQAQEPPSFLANKGPLDPVELTHKQEGTYPTGTPLIDSDPDTGFGLGVQGFVYWDGERKDPLFAYAPYRHRLSVQVLATSNGYQQETLAYDAPYLLDSPFRLRAQLYYERNTAANYFGRGASTMGDLGFTAAGPRTYPTFDSYTTALRQLRLGRAYTLYDKYWLEDPTLQTALERTLAGGLLRVQLGFGGQIVRVRDYTGTPTQADDPATGATDVAATMGTTRLEEDCKAARILGCSGGIHDTIKLGVAFDTRDYEPDPNSGVFADLTAEISSRYVGSSFDYARVTFAPRAFYSPFPRLTDLVVAARVVYSVQTEGVPFFAMNGLAFTDMDRQGLGGLWTLRGYKQDRFVGPISALANVELRWTVPGYVHFLDQDFALQVAPFFDTGRVFDTIGGFTFAQWRYGGGAGLHVLWNKATVIMVEYGVSREDQGLYMDFGQQF